MGRFPELSRVKIGGERALRLLRRSGRAGRWLCDRLLALWLIGLLALIFARGVDVVPAHTLLPLGFDGLR